MRTTLDIDDDVLEAVKERAQEQKKSIGAVLSHYAREGILGPRRDNSQTGSGFGEASQARLGKPWPTFPVDPSQPRRIVTSAMVRRLLDEADFEDGQANDFTKDQGGGS